MSKADTKTENEQEVMGSICDAYIPSNASVYTETLAGTPPPPTYRPASLPHTVIP
jgi:hypothetical protein